MAIQKNIISGVYEIITDRMAEGKGIEFRSLSVSELIEILIKKGLITQEDIR